MGRTVLASHTGLIFRKSARFDVSLSARLRVAEAHAKAVHLTAASGVRQGWLAVDLVDFSAGGIGLLSGVFVPRRSLIQVEIFGLEGEKGGMAISGVARTKRVVMTDRRPAYLIGASFEDPPQELQSQIEQMLLLLGGEPEGESHHA